MGYEDVEKPIPIDIAQGHAHVRGCSSEGRISNPALAGFFAEGPVTLIDVETIWHPIVRDKNIRPMVSVEIGANDAETSAGAVRQPGNHRDILKLNYSVCAPPAIVKKLCDRSLHSLRTAVFES